MENILICPYGLAGRAGIDRTDKAQSLSEHRHLFTAYGEWGNNGTLYITTMTYGNYGRVNTYNTRFTDPQPNGNGTQQTNTSYTYNTANAPSNNFAPVSASNGITFEHGINGSMNKRTTPQKTEYYLYNAFDQMKAYSNNGETYGYYGYDDAGQRTYKYTLEKTSSRTNNVGSNILEVEKLMLYPNGYINIDQKGNYTKHYYADDARIASKIGNGYSTSISSTNITDTMPRFHMKKELGDVTNDIIDNIVYPHGQINNLTGAGVNIQENGLYFYHGNHLSSTQMVTDVNGNVSQAVLYNPWGSIISEYKADWKLDTIPRYFFNSKEKDDESGLYYYEARYYSDQDIVFRARDPLFEKYQTFSPYHYCMNNPVKYIDPTGEEVIITGQAKRQFFREVRKGAKGLGISVRMNGQGMLSAKYTGKGQISANGQKLMSAVNDKSVKVNMRTLKHKGEGTLESKYMFGGKFSGNVVHGETIDGNFVSQSAIADQTVIPSELKLMDNIYGKPGQTSLHEITEAYFGGKIAMREGLSSTGTGSNSYAYDEAHGSAIPQSGGLSRDVFSDSQGDWIEWQSIGTQPIILLKTTDVKQTEIDAIINGM